MTSNWLVILSIFSCCIHDCFNATSSSVEYYEKLIYNGIQSALRYQPPKDASAYKANLEQIEDAGEYDFVIIGGGVTGSVIANRLSERKDFKVLVIEAGNFTDNGVIQIPRLYPLSLFSNYNWAYKSIPQSTACLGYDKEKCSVPRGRGVGGTSLINGLIYSRGHPDNFNAWAKIAKDHSWSYKNVLKYFKKSEHFHWTNPKAPVDLRYHGTKGLLDVQHVVPNIYLNDLFFQANTELGVGRVDYNSNRQLGTSIYQVYTKNGTREDLGSAFVIPFLKRTNLKVLTESYAVKIEINNETKVANSVIFTKGGATYRVRTRKEVILSAGAIASPQILMLSGIGPEQHLKKVNTPVVQDLEVGSSLIDHALAILQFSTNITLSNKSPEQLLEEYIKGTGIFTGSTIPQSVGFYQTSNKTQNSVPNLELSMDINERSPLVKAFGEFKDNVLESLWANHTIGFSFNLIHINPKSKGTVRLKSNDPFDYPLINPKILSDANDEDIKDLYEGLKLIFKLTKTIAFQSIRLKYMSDPLPACKNLKFESKDYWYCFLRQIAMTSFHPTSTCPMGSDKTQGAVVDSNLRVFGIKKLRVADASIFPSPNTGHPSVPCMMIGEKISDIIKNDYPTI